jgi:hypothetical protein
MTCAQARAVAPAEPAELATTAGAREWEWMWNQVPETMPVLVQVLVPVLVSVLVPVLVPVLDLTLA